MKGQIILPTFYLTRWTDNYKVLFNMLRDNLGFKVDYAQVPLVDDDTDVLITFAIPHHSFPDYPIEDIVRLDSKIKLIAYMRDLQCYGRQDCIDRMHRVFDRADLILSPALQLFGELYPDYMEKMYFIPDYFAPYRRYADLGYSDTIFYKCLVSGAASKKVYPLRQYVIDHISEEIRIDYIPPPYGGSHDYVFGKYARLLNSYFCCMTCGSVFNYMLGKHAEIPAAGSLLLTDINADLLSAGFVPGKHFVPIDRGNVMGVIADVLDHPDRYEKVRHEGKVFVRSNHSVLKRYEMVVEGILGRWCGDEDIDRRSHL